jgi:ketosteroid isomerase-like protein
MPPMNVDIVRKAYEAVNRGDLDTAVSCIAPDMKYVASGAVPGATGVFMGPEGVKKFIAGLYEEFDEPRADVSELLDAGDQGFTSREAALEAAGLPD